MMGSVSGRGETLTAVRSTLRESFLASDAESHRLLTLAAVLDDERKSTSNSTVVQTLFDIIRTEETRSSHSTSNHLTSKKAWKSFKERLKLRRNNASNPTRSAAGVNFSSIRRASSLGADAAPAEAISVLSNGDRIQRSSSMRLSAALAAEREMRRLSSVEPAQGESVRMSLMDLLEEPTEHQAGVEEEENRSDEEGGPDEDPIRNEAMEEEEEKGGPLVVGMVCCVCMVRHKGAAFIPCGHTFCRMCSRELWVQRKHCPLCNNFILEILDIF